MAQAQDPSEKPTAADEVPEEIVVEDDEIVVEEAPTGAAATSTATLTDEKTEAVPGAERVVYVSSPTPPKPRSNRIVGSLLALLGAVVFVVVYALVAIVVLASPLGESFPSREFSGFIRDASFWVPVLFFAIGFVLVVLLLNRAAWWAHVLRSLLVAGIVYFGSIGVLLLLNQIGGEPRGFGYFAVNPLVVTAALVAREVSIWIGFLIALRGGRVKTLNKAARQAFDAEQAGTDSSSPQSKAPDGAAPASA